MITSLSAAKWDREDDPDKLSPRDALEAAMRACDVGDVEHVFIVLAKSASDNAVRSEWMQAGSYNYHSQLGLLERAKFDLVNSAA